VENDDFNGELLRRARLGRGIRQPDIAHATGIDIRALARFESGRDVPGPEEVRAIAEALRLSPAAFADPDIRVTADEVEVLRRPGESEEEYRERSASAAPPLTDDAKAAIRAAGDEYWANVRRERRKYRQE
jgi:transcriptional regulator with XRE-family HTH domain